MAQYDIIGKNYSEMIRVEPVKIFVQRPSAIALLGGVKGKSVLDIGCGDGIISRMVAGRGAMVVGIDPSSKQIEIAQEEEKSVPLGIKYQIASIQTFAFSEKFDSALAVMVLCYANDLQELQSFFNQTFSLLKKGGSFVIIDFNREVLPVGGSYYNRFFTRRPKDKIRIEWKVPGVKNYFTEVRYFSIKEFEACAKAAGFKNIKFTNLAPTNEGVEKMGAKYWKQFIEQPIWFGLTMTK